MTAFDQLKQLHEDFSTTWEAFEAARHDADDLITSVADRLEQERELAVSRAAELRRIMNDPERSETVRRVAAGEMAKLQTLEITATMEETAAFAELLGQQQAALRDLKQLQQNAKPLFDAATGQIANIRAEVLGHQYLDIAPRWTEGQQIKFEKLSK